MFSFENHELLALLEDRGEEIAEGNEDEIKKLNAEIFYLKNQNIEKYENSLEERIVIIEQNMKSIIKKLNKLKL